jgi:uncharacterized protein
LDDCGSLATRSADVSRSFAESRTTLPANRVPRQVKSPKVLTIKDNLSYNLFRYALVVRSGAFVFGAGGNALADTGAVKRVDWVVDALRFAENADRLSGTLSVEELPRLADECLEDFQPFEMRAAGVHSPRGRSGIEIWLQGSVTVECQRCLKPLALELSPHAAFELARTEAEADAQSVILDEDDVWDAVVGTERFDLAQLGEDELMLALPFAPMHEACEPAAPAEAGEKISPFAVLAGLKKSK